MRARWQRIRAAVPPPFLAALALCVGFLGFVAWDQSHWWRVKEDYSFGWLVPGFVMFVLHYRRAEISEALQHCGAEGSPRAAGWQKWLWRVAIAATLLFGVLLFLLGSFYRAGAGTSNPGTLAITMGAIAILLPLLWINAPRPACVSRSGLWNDARVKLVGLFLFPVLVWLVSAPMVSVIETQLNLTLLRKVVTVVAFVFDVLGMPVERQGNVLALPNGNVGVEDACSGIRSLTGCFFAGSFLAAVYVDRLWKKIALLIAALLLAFFANLARSLFLTTWAYNFGPRAIEGAVHEVAGYAVLGLTIVGLLGFLPVLNSKIVRPATRVAPETSTT
jgi:exosortase/archaeosortase family protein